MTDFSPHHNRGVALVILLTIIILAVTTVLVTQVSSNRLTTARITSNANVLDDAVQALLGYALLQSVAGELP